MTDAGKKALEELVAGIGRCEHDGGFDREIGPIGCMLGDKCVCAGAYPLASKALEEFATLEARYDEQWTAEYQRSNEKCDTLAKDYEAIIDRKDAEISELNKANVAYVDANTALISRATAAEERVKEVITAWEALPGGTQYVKDVERWLINDMKPVIDKLRAALTGEKP